MHNRGDLNVHIFARPPGHECRVGGHGRQIVEEEEGPRPAGDGHHEAGAALLVRAVQLARAESEMESC